MGNAAGEQLREARELKGLTIEDVAARLKVPARYIRALEDGDIAALPEPTFVRGYARAYARALGVDADALLEQLAPVELKAPKPLVAVDGGTTVRKASAVRTPNFRAGASRRRFGVMVAVALVLVVVVFAFVALRERHQQIAAEAVVAAPSVPVAPSSPGASAVPPSAPVPSVPVVAAPAGQAVTLEIHLPLPPSSAPATNPAGVAAIPTAAAQPVASSPAGNTAAVGTVAPAAAARTSPAPAGTGSTPAPAVPEANIPAHGLYIRFRGPSWVEVRDAGNRVLHSGTPAAGTDLSLDGKAPLSVTFSDSSVADVWYNGVRQQDRSSGHARVNRIIVGQPVR